ncbi:MAG: DNA/RNA nuclease SfsA [Clostridia bacterium]|nr:DNA/RNA nuclease SfsA [Clostridia bacterium]
MKYQNVHKAIFISRPNRFIAEVELEGEKVIAHVKNTGRCRELLIPGATVFLDEPQGRERKTKYDLVAVEKICEDGRELLINMDSQAPNEAVSEFLLTGKIFPNATLIRREFTVGKSRFDFRIDEGEKTTFLEVKGVTLENNGIAGFPDAPTERGIKHIEELIELKKQGVGAAILFIIQMKGISKFQPNDLTHKAFGDALRRAETAGVEILAYDCIVAPDSVTVDSPVEIDLK